MGMDPSVLPGGKSLVSGFSVMETHVMPPTVTYWWGCPAVWNRSWRMRAALAGMLLGMEVSNEVGNVCWRK